MSIIFFHFLKIIFDISTSKQSKKYKPHLILKKKIQNLMKHSYMNIPNMLFPKAKLIKYFIYICEGQFYFNIFVVNKTIY